MPTKPTSKHTHKPRHPERASSGQKRTPNGRFKGQPRTLSETSMPEEYAPATEAPREAAEKPVPVVKPLSALPPAYASGSGGCAIGSPGGVGTVPQIACTSRTESVVKVELSDADIKRAISRVYGIRIRSVGPWYRRLWAAVREWLR